MPPRGAVFALVSRPGLRRRHDDRQPKAGPAARVPRRHGRTPRARGKVSQFRVELSCGDVGVKGMAATIPPRTRPGGSWRSGMAQNPLRTCPGWPRMPRDGRTRKTTLPRCSVAFLASRGACFVASGDLWRRSRQKPSPAGGGRVGKYDSKLSTRLCMVGAEARCGARVCGKAARWLRTPRHDGSGRGDATRMTP
jgi:hypothetical protein